MARRGLLLGGGGITGIAWELGVLRGLSEEGVQLAEADTVLGTSAGSVVGSLLLSRNMEELFESQHLLGDPALRGRFSIPRMLRAAPGLANPRPVGGLERRRRIARAAMRAHPPVDDSRVELFRERLGLTGWPDADLRITTMNALTGELRVFDRHSGADIVRVITASCSVPFVWAPVVIDGVPYLDGGTRSPVNADLVNDVAAAVALAPITLPMARYHHVHNELRRAGARHRLAIHPDQASRKVIGRRILDPSRADAAAAAGEVQGRRLAPRVAEHWDEL